MTRSSLFTTLSVIVTVLLATTIIVPLIASGDAAVAATQPSWNPNVGCPATLMSLEQLVGLVPNPSQSSPNQGADYSGGMLHLAGVQSPGTNPSSSSWPFSKRSLSPPCSVLVGGVVYPTLVEIHNVKVTWLDQAECGIVFAGFCDNSVDICNSVLAPNCTDVSPDSMHRIHTEIDMYWGHAGTAPSSPAKGALIDVQGFVFWDDAHLADSWHYFSGWELHPLTAWRPAGSGPPPGPLATSFTVNPSSPVVGQAASYVASASGGVSPYSFSWTFGDGTSASGTNVSHSYAAAGTYSVQLSTSDSTGSSATASRTVTVSGPVVVPDFSLSVVPGTVSVKTGSSARVQVTVTSLGGFTGSVKLSATTTTSGLHPNLSSSTINLVPGGTGSVSLSISAGRHLRAGTYIVMVSATFGTVVHTFSLTVQV